MEAINSFFKWWITDSEGREYMTLIQCSWNDPVWIWLFITSLMVVAIYLFIGHHSLMKARKYPNSLAKNYLRQKRLVFVFCACTGYLMVAISVFLNPYKLRVLLNLILFFWSYRFYESMKKSNVVEGIYKAELKIKELQEKLYTKLFQSNIKESIGSDVIWSIELDKWIPLEGIRFKVIERDNNKAISITECDPESTFGLHEHPDLKESVEVLQGHLIDNHNNRYAGEGETIKYKKGELHEPSVKVFSRYKVTFEK